MRANRKQHTDTPPLNRQGSTTAPGNTPTSTQTRENDRPDKYGEPSPSDGRYGYVFKDGERVESGHVVGSDPTPTTELPAQTLRQRVFTRGRVGVAAVILAAAGV